MTPPAPVRFTDRSARRAGPRAGLALTLALAGAVPAQAWATTVGPVTELATPVASQRAPAVSWDAQRQVYVIVWEDRRNVGSTGIDLYVARISATGALLDASGFPLLDPSAAVDDETQASIVYNPTTFAHLVAWTEARDGLNDIFFTRVFANPAAQPPTIVPTAGVQVTSSTDVEIEPSVAVGFQTFLVSYQVNTVGGGRLIRGRRVYPDGSFLDDAPFPVSPQDAASPSALGMGSNFAVAWQGNGDIYARLVPDFGLVGTGTAASYVAVSTATLGQSRVSLGYVGTNAQAVWADNRAFDTLDADVFGRRFTPGLMALGPEAAVATATAAQQFPVIAGCGPLVVGPCEGTLVAWQDRRFSAANAVIYGARLDTTTGALRDPDGFLLLALSANAFEPAVAKGPDGDFLVAAVRFDATTPRIFYRIVRDEVPAGTMSAMGTLTAPADGVTTAEVVFGPAVGASGLAVAKDTLYTVTLSSNGVEIVQPDADPNLPGHQVKSTEGEVQVSLRTIEHILVDVTVASVEGTSSGTGQVTFLNVAPVATQVVVGPNRPRSVEPLQLTYLYSDVNLDPENGTTVQWTANSQIQPSYQNQTTVPANATRKGEQWRAEVRPRDGIEFGTRVFSNTVIVQNTPPAALDPRIIPDTNVRTGTALQGRYVFRDPDGDAQSGSEIRWYERGAEQVALRDQLDVPAAQVEKGQRWWFTVRPSDADPLEPFGPLVGSATVTVVNTPPTANAGLNGQVLERRRYSLNGTGSSDDDPRDVLAFTWQQVQTGTEPQVQISSTSSPTPSFLAPSVEGTTFLTFDLVVADDEVTSTADRVTVEISAVPDTDADGLDDEEEVVAGTNPAVADTDRDGLRDGEEVKGIRSGGVLHPLGTDPLDQDSDDDGVRDGAEGRTTKDGDDFDPAGDPDGDQRPNALDPDSDDDGILDGTELGVRSPLGSGENAGFAYAGTDEGAGRFVADVDPATQTNPIVADTDGDGFEDGVEDANHDGAIDDGESDPNDPEDPGIACTAGGAECPDGFGCVDGVCRVGATDAGLMCTPLPDTVECCVGGCELGTLVAPVCVTNGTRERCPVGADQCIAGACSVPTTPPPASEGCSCRADSAARGGPGWLLGVLLGGLLVARRRRR
jgi:MYXO-CTERM domain-containing protein